MNIIVDKSFVIGSSLDELKNLSKDNNLILPAVLAYELSTTEKKDQSKVAWAKLNTISKNIKLIERINDLMKYEIENQKPFGNIEDFFCEFSFSVDDAILNSEFTKQQKFIINRLKIEWEKEGFDNYKIISSNVFFDLPEIQNIKGQSSVDYLPFLEKVANDEDLIKNIYTEIKPKKFPPVKKLNKNWAIFRYLQMNIMAGIEYTRKYGIGNINVKSKNAINDNLDLEYTMLGVLCKNIASNDEKIKLFFKLCCPEGNIFYRKVRA